MKSTQYFLIKALRRLIGKKFEKYPLGYDEYVDLKDQEANDYVYSFLSNERERGKMISKFGTVELAHIVATYFDCHRWTMEYIKDILAGNASFNLNATFPPLCTNAGFFPSESQLGRNFYDRMLQDMTEIDVLGSYVYQEKYVDPFLKSLKKRVNLEGYYAPFMWKNPWTRLLEGKKVLVVHPFVESIRRQYEQNRIRIWANPDVLPEFGDLLTLKAVQSIADAKDQPYANWFEALAYMENEISKTDFDIALIGCGAYGMCLAAHVKRMGKIAVHLAGWTQMLFGVYGTRWVEQQPRFSKFINEYWIRPNAKERPKGAEKVEGACYW
jgi:hypothetical protein